MFLFDVRLGSHNIVFACYLIISEIKRICNKLLKIYKKKKTKRKYYNYDTLIVFNVL